MQTSSSDLPSAAGLRQIPRANQALNVTSNPSHPSADVPSASSHDSSSTLSALQALCYIIVVAIFTVTLILQPFRIPSASMEPTLLVGDFLLVNKREPTPGDWLSPFPSSIIHRRDIVVFRYPIDPTLHLVKRVIGLPGDRLRMRSGRVFINGAPLDEPYAVYRNARVDSFRDDFPHLESTDPDVDARWWMQMHRLVDRGELRIPAEHYFVLGDNRNDSEDSRYWGLVPRSSIVGEPFLVYFSLRDPSEDAELRHSDLQSQHPEQDKPRSLDAAILGLARWNRILHVVR